MNTVEDVYRLLKSPPQFKVAKSLKNVENWEFPF